jgi:hypothetical protein
MNFQISLRLKNKKTQTLRDDKFSFVIAKVYLISKIYFSNLWLASNLQVHLQKNNKLN